MPPKPQVRNPDRVVSWCLRPEVPSPKNPERESQPSFAGGHRREAQGDLEGIGMRQTYMSASRSSVL